MLNSKEILLLKRIREDTSYANWFFREAKHLKWFYPLKEEGYFKPENIQFTPEGNAQFWNVLDYLERVSEQIKKDSFIYGKELIEIFKTVVSFSKHVKKINNYHIWWLFSKILNHLPIKTIKEFFPINDQIEQGKTQYGFRTCLLTSTDPFIGNHLSFKEIGDELLGKLFLNDSTLEYAEVIVDLMTRVIPSGRKLSYRRGENPILAWDDYWLMESFKKNHELIGKKCSLELILEIANKLRTSIQYKYLISSTDIEIDSKFYMIDVKRIFHVDETDRTIKFKSGIYECIGQQFSDDLLKNKEGKDTLFFYYTKPDIEIFRFGFEGKTRDAFIKQIRTCLSERLNFKTVQDLNEKLDNLYDGLWHDYSSGWIKSLSQINPHLHDAEEILVTILKDILLSKCKINPSDGKKILTQFMSELYPFPLFKRFVLLCIERDWENFSEYFQIYLDHYGFEINDCLTELYSVLQKHNDKFSVRLKEQLKALIDDVPAYFFKDNEDRSPYWKHRWLSPLKENPYFSSYYNEIIKVISPNNPQIKPFKPDISIPEAHFVGNVSPLTKEEILNKSVLEIVSFLNNFQETDRFAAYDGKPTREGLSNVLQETAKDNPKIFSSEIDQFLGVSPDYLEAILRGEKNAWDDKKEIDWQKLFDFYLKQFSLNAQQVTSLNRDGGKFNWMINVAVDLIASGCRDDSRAFDPSFFPVAEKIFDSIFPLLYGEKKPEIQHDGLTFALNTTLGRTIESFINFSLRIARVLKVKESNWGNEKYEKFLGIGIEAYIWLGRYLPQLMYLDRDYTITKINNFASSSSEDFEWRMFMEAYLFEPQVYADLYKLMRPNYLMAIKNKVFNEEIDRKLVEHISVVYLHGEETLNEKNSNGEISLFWKLLSDTDAPAKKNRWIEIARFFWSLTDRKLERAGDEEKPSDKIKNKILSFWAWTYDNQEIAKERLDENYFPFLGRMSMLTILLDKIDDESEKWLCLSAPHIDREHNSSFLIEYLTKFEDAESIRKIGKIYIELLKNTTPTYQQENIELIVTRIYENGIFNDAEEICDIYGRRGIHFLKSIWEKYRRPNT